MGNRNLPVLDHTVLPVTPFLHATDARDISSEPGVPDKISGDPSWSNRLAALTERAPPNAEGFNWGQVGNQLATNSFRPLRRVSLFAALLGLGLRPRHVAREPIGRSRDRNFVLFTRMALGVLRME